MRYPVPPRYQDGFRNLVAFGDEEFERLAVALESERPTLRVDELTSSAIKTADVDQDKAASAMDAVYSAASLMARDDSSAGEIIASLDIEELGIDRPSFDRRMGRLLAIEAVRTSARAVQLAVADERVLTSSRIITDIRPVFTPRGEDPLVPMAALVLHSLRIDYMEDGEQGTFRALLDRRDLKRLRRVVDRALAKGDSIVSLIERTDLAYLGEADED